MARRTRVLWYSDFLCHSGFARVAHNIVRQLLATGAYDIEVLAINHHGEPYNHPHSPWHEFAGLPVYPSTYYAGDHRGERRLFELLATHRYDLLFALVNPWDLARYGRKLRTVLDARKTRLVHYFPIEQDASAEWVADSIAMADCPVAYTNFGALAVMLAGGPHCDVIYHGVDSVVFRPEVNRKRVEAFRRAQFGAGPDDVLLLNVNRNQVRKDLPRTMLAADELRERLLALKRTVRLVLHAHPKDPAGHDLEAFHKAHCPDLEVTFTRSGAPISDTALCAMYNAADMVLTTAWCEGWGLSTTEAMACARPIVAPHTSVFSELLGQQRGELAPVEGLAMIPGQTELFRPVDVSRMAHALERVLLEPGTVRTAQARAWVEEHCQWQAIGEQWHELLQATVDR